MMDNFEIDSCLKSMSILCDTREKPTGKRAANRYKSFGCPHSRATLNYGDYTYNFTLPDGKAFYGDSDAIYPDVCIERKMNLEELSQCFCQSRARFEREMQRATEHGAKIYLLVENASYENLINGKYKTKFNANAFTASLFAWSARYNITPIFCKSETSGTLIYNILYRELKERLNRGQYG